MMNDNTKRKPSKTEVQVIPTLPSRAFRGAPENSIGSVSGQSGTGSFFEIPEPRISGRGIRESFFRSEPASPAGSSVGSPNAIDERRTSKEKASGSLNLHTLDGLDSAQSRSSRSDRRASSVASAAGAILRMKQSSTSNKEGQESFVRSEPESPAGSSLAKSARRASSLASKTASGSSNTGDSPGMREPRASNQESVGGNYQLAKAALMSIQGRRGGIQSLMHSITAFDALNEQAVLGRIADGSFKLEFADDALRSNRRVVLAAVDMDGMELRHASPALQADMGVVLAAVEQNGMALEHAAPKLQTDRTVVLKAVAQRGIVLLNADERFKSDPEVVLLAMRSNFGLIKCADYSLRCDEEFARRALIQDARALLDLDQRFRKDEEFLLSTLSNPDALRYADSSIKNRPAFMRMAVAYQPKVVSYIGKDLTNPKFICDVVANTPEALAYVNEDWFTEYQNGKAKVVTKEDLLNSVLEKNPYILDEDDFTLDEETKQKWCTHCNELSLQASQANPYLSRLDESMGRSSSEPIHSRLSESTMRSPVTRRTVHFTYSAFERIVSGDDSEDEEQNKIEERGRTK